MICLNRSNMSENDPKGRNFGKQIEREVFIQQDACCANCGKDMSFFPRGMIEYHHVIPYHISHDSSLENCVMLCPNCHALIHEWNKQHPQNMWNKQSIELIEDAIFMINCDLKKKYLSDYLNYGVEFKGCF